MSEGTVVFYNPGIGNIPRYKNKFPHEFYIMSTIGGNVGDEYELKLAHQLFDARLLNCIDLWKKDFPLFKELVISHRGGPRVLEVAKFANLEITSPGIFLCGLYSAMVIDINDSMKYFSSDRWIDF